MVTMVVYNPVPQGEAPMALLRFFICNKSRMMIMRVRRMLRAREIELYETVA